jgi:hypothetical protein
MSYKDTLLLRTTVPQSTVLLEKRIIVFEKMSL